jgi:hypothetical protein
MNDPYLDYITAQWPLISDIYNQYIDYQPIMLLNAQEGEIHALPYADFVSRLDAASQATVIAQYHRALANRHMLLFVRDDGRQVLQSYTLQLEDERPVPS